MDSCIPSFFAGGDRLGVQKGGPYWTEALRLLELL